MTVSGWRRGTRRRTWATVPAGVGCLLALTLATAGCTSTTQDPAPTGPVTAAETSAATGSTAATKPPTTAPSVTPVTDDGMLTGPGVDTASISLGLMVDPAADRGFSAGVTLWQETVNNTGGICGRTIQLTGPTDGATVDEAYAELGRSTLGLITLEPGATGLSLASRIRSDRIPTFTPVGTAEKMADAWSPVVLGATDDILAINTAAHLMTTGVITAGGTLGVQIDDSAGAADVLAGLTWWAQRNDVTLQTLEAGEPFAADIPAIFAATGPQEVADLLSATSPGGNTTTGPGTAAGGDTGDTGAAGDGTGSDTEPATTGSITPTSPATSHGGEPSGTLTEGDAGPADSSGTPDTAAEGSSGTEADGSSGTGTDGSSGAASTDSVAAGATSGIEQSNDASAGAAPVIATTLSGYDPALLPSGTGDRLLVATVTPVSGADHPVVQAVDTAFAEADLGDGGPRMLAGYATGDTWGRLLEAMCDARTLTRASAGELLTTLPAASPDGLFGPVDPVAQVTAGLPANRVSAMSIADPSAPGGLRAVSLLESAPGIGDYRAG